MWKCCLSPPFENENACRKVKFSDRREENKKKLVKMHSENNTEQHLSIEMKKSRASKSNYTKITIKRTVHMLFIQYTALILRFVAAMTHSHSDSLCEKKNAILPNIFTDIYISSSERTGMRR